MKKQLITLHEFVVQVYQMTESDFFAEHGIDNINNIIPLGERKLKVIHDYAMFLQQSVTPESFESEKPLFDTDFTIGGDGSIYVEGKIGTIGKVITPHSEWKVIDFIGSFTHYNQYQ